MMTIRESAINYFNPHNNDRGERIPLGKLLLIPGYCRMEGEAKFVRFSSEGCGKFECGQVVQEMRSCAFLW